LLNKARLACSDAAINEAAAALLSETTGTHYQLSPDVERAQIVSEIKTLLNQSLAKRIKLFELANRFYLSPFTVSRWFHWETGVPLRRYIQRLRLRRALTFMLDEKRSLTAIALELGFYDEAHFSKAFHAEFGTPPALALRAYADTPLSRPFAVQSIPD
jgi:transcriptional regulator GlxA family with amidase domain